MNTLRKLLKRLEIWVENFKDTWVVKKTDFLKGKSFEEVAAGLGI